MRQTHLAGEKLFVDHAGQTVPLVDAATGEITAAQIFVATLGASNYTYACATGRQTTADWIGAQIQALEFFGGVPRLIVPDQARALIKRPDRYDPEPNALYDEFSAHYGCALLTVTVRAAQSGILKLKLTPFHGHLTVTEEESENAQIKAAVPGGVSPTDHRAGARRQDAGRVLA